MVKKIYSVYILRNLFDYLQYNTKLNICKYSKVLQKKLNLDIFSYQKEFFEQNGINFFDYLSTRNDIHLEDVDKEYLKDKLKKDLSIFNLEFKNIEKFIIKYFESYDYNNIQNEVRDYIYNKFLYIDIFSPFYDILSETKIFDKVFTITISTDIIKKYDLTNYYISEFDRLNKLNYKYSSLFLYYKENDINYLKSFNINFNKIERLNIINFMTEQMLDGFYKDLFSITNFGNNLIELSIDLDLAINDTNIFERINTFVLLEKLYLFRISFDNYFSLKLNNLKELELSECYNLELSKETCLNLIKLILDECSVIRPNLPLQFPNLEECELNYPIDDVKYDIHTINDFNTIIDFKSLHKLKKFKGYFEDFFDIEKSLLEKVDIAFGPDIDKEKEIKYLEKVLSIKTLKDANFDIEYLDNDDIVKISGVNKSLKNLRFYFKSIKNDFIAYNLQDKFPNVSNLELSCSLKSGNGINLQIKENSTNNIRELKLLLWDKGNNIQLYCQSFENLTHLEIKTYNEIINIIDALPFFNYSCETIFKSLTYLSFCMDFKIEMSFDLIKNLYNNLECFPNLKVFIIECYSPKIDKIFYEKFILKILKLNLKSISVKIKNKSCEQGDYTVNEIKNMFPDIKNPNFNNIKISKIVIN